MKKNYEEELENIEEDAEEDAEENTEEQKEKTQSKKSNVSKAFAESIKVYLDNYAKENEFFRVKYSNENKSIDECCAFIIGEVQKMKVNGLSDDEVYYLARHYYEEDNLKVNPLPYGLKVTVNHHIELSEEEKEKIRKNVLEEFKREEKAKLLKAEAKKKEREEKAKNRALEAEKKRLENSGQLSIFDF